MSAADAPLGQIESAAVDSAGNLYIADFSDNRVMRISPGGILAVVAGNGVQGFSGDGGPATSASLNGPSGLAVDSGGNLYIADQNNSRIRRVSGGVIATVAGNGTQEYSGDGGPSVSASLNQPSGVAVDSVGNLYIADQDNNRIREVSGGVITTVAGNGTEGDVGDGGPATSAFLGNPDYIVVDAADNLYIADQTNCRIRKVSHGIITTVVGNGNQGYSGDGGPATKASLNQPAGVAVDPAGNLYIADWLNQVIRKVSGGIITTVAGTGAIGYSGDGGPATNASLNFPIGVAVDSASNLYIADTYNNRLRKVSGNIITTTAGNGTNRYSGDGGPATGASFNGPSDVAVDSAGNLYIADTNNNRIRKVSGGIITTVAGSGSAGYSGDGGPATSAQLNGPTGVAVDFAGNIYIGDGFNPVVRKVSGGIITTVAGNGVQGYSGDGGRATNASLYLPSGVAVDSVGNLYIADASDNVIRKVSDGIITTVAGGFEGVVVFCVPFSINCAGFSGDGGPATSAQLNGPGGVAVDSTGNIYIADSGNNRIRKVSGGIITTVAGSGPSCSFTVPCGGFSGDGGPATSAQLNGPDGVSVDSTGNLYIADTYNNSIRRVSGGIITTVAGDGFQGYSGDGGLATGASLDLPSGVFVDSTDDLYIADYGNNRIREVLGYVPSFSKPSPSGSLSLLAASGGKQATATLNATANGSEVAIPGMTYSASVTNGSSWLSVSPQAGSTPGLITVTADPLNLSAGTYNGVLVLSVPLANPPIQTVNVQFTVTPGAPASVSIDKNQLSFTYATASAARTQTITVSNQGGGSLPFTASVSLDSGQSANWLTVVPASGTATPSAPVALAVGADAGNLPPGTYTGQVTITGAPAGSGSVVVPVAMTITTNPLILLLSQAGLTFTVVQNGGVIPAQTFGVLNLGSGTLNWTVQTSTLAGGNWLSATPGSGASDASNPGGAPLVTVSVSPANLNPGAYYGLVKVISAGAANTPQEVVAVLQVLPAGTDVGPIVQPNSLIFTAAAGDSSPGSQNVLVYDPTGTGKSFRSGIVTVDGASWLVTLPSDATIPPTEPAQIVVQPIVNGLSPGTYQGTLTLQFSDGRVSAIGITFVVTAPGASSAVSSSGKKYATRAADATGGTCTATQLSPKVTTLGPGFNVPAGFPQGVQAQVVDDCGVALLAGTVFVQFSNGDAVLKLQSLNNGRWDGTWQPGGQQVSQVTLTVTAQDAQGDLKGTSQLTGSVGALQPSPQVLAGGVVSAASYAATPLAPGGIIAIYGQTLSDGAAAAVTLPLPTTLDGTTVLMGDQVLPLFFVSDGQLNALVPYEVNLNTNQELLVERDTTYATPVRVNVAAAQPGVFQTLDGQAIITDMQGNLISAANPAHAGDVIVIYCTGLGAVNPAVADGSGSTGAASTVNPATVMIGGQTASVGYAGLTPGYAGLYQINVTVPAGVAPGDQVEVTVTLAGQASAAVNLSVR
jgi:uncharacterized protein (TIGR03437 family)